MFCRRSANWSSGQTGPVGRRGRPVRRGRTPRRACPDHRPYQGWRTWYGHRHVLGPCPLGISVRMGQPSLPVRSPGLRSGILCAGRWNFHCQTSSPVRCLQSVWLEGLRVHMAHRFLKAPVPIWAVDVSAVTGDAAAPQAPTCATSSKRKTGRPDGPTRRSRTPRHQRQDSAGRSSEQECRSPDSAPSRWPHRRA